MLLVFVSFNFVVKIFFAKLKNKNNKNIKYKKKHKNNSAKCQQQSIKLLFGILNNMINNPNNTKFKQINLNKVKSKYLNENENDIITFVSILEMIGFIKQQNKNAVLFFFKRS